MATGVQIYFEVFDETAAQEASFSCASVQGWVDYSQLTDGVYPDDENEDPQNPALRRYVTGETGAVTLDGSCRLFPDSPGPNMGYWSAAMSGADGSFSTPPVLVCSFGDTAHESVGLTIHFDVSTHLSDFTVEWRGASGAVLASKEVTGNAASTVFVEQHVEDYTEVRVTCEKTDAPWRYVKIQEIEFGQRMTYHEGNLVSASLTEEADLSGASVPAGSLQLEVVDPEGRLNPVNPQGIYTYLRRGMALHVAFLRDGARYPGGLYYLDAWEGTDAATAKLTAVDAVGLKASLPYSSAFYRSGTAASVILADIFTRCALDGSVASGVGSGTYTGYIPDCTLQEALAHACVACGGYVRSGRDGSVDILPPPSDADSPLVIGQGAVLGEPKATKSQEVGQITVEEYSYTVSSTQDLYETPRIWLGPDPQYYRYAFDGVYTGMTSWIQSEIGSGSASQEDIRYDYHSVEFYAWESADYGPMYVDIRGYPVEEARTLRSLNPGAAGDGVELTGIPLITRSNLTAVSQRMQDYYSRSLQIKLRTPWTPGLECGARVTVPTRFGNVTGNVTRLDIDLTGGLLAAMEVLA